MAVACTATTSIKNFFPRTARRRRVHFLFPRVDVFAGDLERSSRGTNGRAKPTTQGPGGADLIDLRSGF